MNFFKSDKDILEEKYNNYVKSKDERVNKDKILNDYTEYAKKFLSKNDITILIDFFNKKYIAFDSFITEKSNHDKDIYNNTYFSFDEYQKIAISTLVAIIESGEITNTFSKFSNENNNFKFEQDISYDTDHYNSYYDFFSKHANGYIRFSEKIKGISYVFEVKFDNEELPMIIRIVPQNGGKKKSAKKSTRKSTKKSTKKSSKKSAKKSAKKSSKKSSKKSAKKSSNKSKKTRKSRK